VRDEHDRPVSRGAELAPGQTIALEFADGRVAAIAGEGDGGPLPGSSSPSSAPSKPAAPKPVRKADPPTGQGSLF